jgi:hypothetical protein
MMITGRSVFSRFASRISVSPSHARHFQVGNQQIVISKAQALERGAAIRRDVDLIFRERQRLLQQLPNARFVVNDEHAAVAVACLRPVRPGGRGSAIAARTLRIQPGVDVTLAEAAT